MTLEKLLTLRDVAELIGWGKTRVHRAAAIGELPAIILSQGPHRRSFRVRPSDLEKWLKARDVRDESR